MPALVIDRARVVTMDDQRRVVDGGVAIRDGMIAAVGDVPAEFEHAARLDARGGFVLPGFVQTHVHLCQTLFRGRADDMPLLDWLRTRIWPMEAAHTAASLRASAALACLELLASGTTSVLTMETVHDTDAVVETVADCGLRATIGKCMMDAAPDAPARLQETAAHALDESLALHRRWHRAAGGRIDVALAPRFAVSCSRELLEATAAASLAQGLLVHTHASENRDEVDLVRRRTGLPNVEYLADTGLASPRLCAAHCVWVDASEQQRLAEHDVKVLHCPGSNLKLGSGLAPIVELRDAGVCVSLGADGGACNNRLDMFDEMRLAATMQAVRRGPGSLTAFDVLWMATREGARTLGREAETGSIEPGKRADLIVVDGGGAHMAPGADPYSTLVYAARGSDVRTVLVDGEVLYDEFRPTKLDAEAIVAAARAEAARLAERAGE